MQYEEAAMSSPTNTFDLDLDDDRSKASSDVLGSSAALQIRQLERERRLREIERTFQNVVSEAESQEGRIYENVFTERGEVHNEVNIKNKEYEIEQSRPKSVAGKLKEKAINQLDRITKKNEAFDFEVQSKTAAGNFDDYIPASDFTSHKQMNRPSSPNHARMVYNFAVTARRHSSKIAIALLIFITAIATTVTLTALKEAPIPMTLSEETWENLKAIRTALIDQGIPKGPLMVYESKQFAAVTQLAEEVDLGELSIGSIVDKSKPFVEINSDGVPTNFNNAYKERRVVLERYIVMTLYLTTSNGSKEWVKKENWMKNNVNICKGWHGIDCMELAGDEITMEVVSSLKLPSNEIHGKIPVELSFLQQLQSLNLSNNFLIGAVPASLGEIKTLQKVELSRNLLTGQIPSSFCTLKSDFVLVELVSDCGGDFTCSCCTECL